ncbi:hypothetical protein JYU34_018853 [Plutella xylostella]|uniref:Phospholipid/glycerol acyltransferase domain-containing protein n=1 Tax=Plutella xylostella TaxID=51655 RepID=A0ABQ7PZG2_PLUXY|nr:hypothetical protein JYU34_018853 [Plutella xylostella]
MSANEKFLDILVPRRKEASVFQYMTRPWNPQKTFNLDQHYSPTKIKAAAANSVYIDAILEAESANTGVCKKKLKKEILKYLDEMGMEKKQCVIRWMGTCFLKVASMMKIGIFVNETAALKMRSVMGNNPLLLLPTHRSYADFCLLTYFCYHYDMDFPAVAAGMDFYSMAVVGRCMRDTCAFYIRRSLVGQGLYAATLKQYVRTLVAKHCAPIEFFLEGTRSRSNKTLPPKYGMLSMSLMPLFAGEVPDVTVVPVNISYDRLVEHSLFAYEHLGVPKPKESTGGLLKALKSLNEHFGNIYINLGEPLSVKEFLHSSEAHPKDLLKPTDLQQLTPEQFSFVQDIANHVADLQQKCTVVTISYLVALVLMQSIIKNTALTFEEVLEEVEWVIKVLRQLGASVFENDVKSSVERILIVHSKMMKLDKDNKLKLISSMPMDISSEVQRKMKGHILAAETMINAVPVIQVQLYVNPVLLYLAPAAVVTLVVSRGHATHESLTADYHCIRKMLRHELFHLEKHEDEVLKQTLQYCLDNGVIAESNGTFVLGRDEKLQYFLKWSIWAPLLTIVKCAETLLEHNKCEHKQALKLIQERVESSQCHPYCLSLEATANCLQGLVLAGALEKGKTNENVTYQVIPATMGHCHRLVKSVLPAIQVDFGKSNSVILDQRKLTSRL